MIYVDLNLGDLGYFEARVQFKNCTEPQAAGAYDIRCWINFNDREVEVFEQLKQQAKDYIADAIYKHLEGAA